MPDENTSTAPQPQTTPAASSSQPASEAPPARVYTQAEVDAMVTDRERRAHDAGAAAARRALEGRSNGTRTAAEVTPTASPATHTQAATSALDIARVVTFTTEAAQHGIPPAGIELLATRLDAERPTDVRAWVAQQADAFGWRKPAATTTSTPTATPTAASAVTQASTNTVPVTGNASPSNPTTVLTDDVPLWRRTEDQRQQFIREKGWPAYTARFTEESIRDGVRFRLPR